MDVLSMSSRLSRASPSHESMTNTCAGVLANLKRAGNYLEGFVEGWKELIILLELHKRTTTSTFGTRDSRGPFHQSDFGFDGTRTVTLGKVKSPRLLWQSTANPMVPFDGVPFLICGRKVLECQYGPKRDARRRKPDEKGDDIMGKVGEAATRISRKRGCPATITVRRIVRFPDHALFPEDMGKGKSDWAIREKKADILFRLKTRLRNGQVQGKERFYVQLPCDEAHQLHPTSGEEACMSQKLHPAIIDKIYELVNNGLQDVNKIKDELHTFVEGEFSLGATKAELDAILDQNNRAYYPTNHDIRNHMYHANQQNKKKRSGCLLDAQSNKKRRTLISNSPGAKLYDEADDYSDFFKKGFESLSTECLANSRPYGITPPRNDPMACFTEQYNHNEQPSFVPSSEIACYPPPLGHNPLEQAQSGLMLGHPRTKIEADAFNFNYSCEQNIPLSFPECGSIDSAFKNYSPPVPTIGHIENVIGSANHLYEDSFMSRDTVFSSPHHVTPQPRVYGSAGPLYYDHSSPNYISSDDGYLDTLSSNYMSDMTSSPLTSPNLSHSLVSDALTHMNDTLHYSPCAQTPYSPHMFSKPLGPCTELVKASMDLV